MAADTPNDNQKRDFWLYVGLGFSGLLNLTGLASIVDGLVVWAKFFREFIDTYHWAIRDPLSYLGNAIWPFGHLPKLIFDVLVVHGSIFLAFNIFFYQKYKFSFLKHLFNVFRRNLFQGIYEAVSFAIFLPLTLIGVFIGVRTDITAIKQGYNVDTLKTRNYINDLYGIGRNFIYIIACFVFLLFINWQIKRLGG